MPDATHLSGGCTSYAVVSLAVWLALRCRPSGRTVCSRPRSLTVVLTQSSVRIPPSGARRASARRACAPAAEKKSGQSTVILRPDNEVPMVGHNTVRQDTNGLPLVRLYHHALERLEVGVLAEHVHPPDRSVQDVINEPSRCYPRCSRHETIPTKTADRCQYWSRVESRCGAVVLGSAYLFPALSFAGASLALPCSVSTSRSSNPACGFPAPGFRTRLHSYSASHVRPRTVAATFVEAGTIPASGAGVGHGTVSFHDPAP